MTTQDRRTGGPDHPVVGMSATSGMRADEREDMASPDAEAWRDSVDAPWQTQLLDPG